MGVEISNTLEKPKTKTLYILIIRTDTYAGNIEREMCGFVGGGYGECEVGKEHHIDFGKYADANGIQLAYDHRKGDYPGEQYFGFLPSTSVQDDHGCSRPVSIWNHLGGSSYNDVAIFLEALPTDEQLKVVRARANEFARSGLPGSRLHDIVWKPFNILGLEMIERKTTVADRTIGVPAP